MPMNDRGWAVITLDSGYGLGNFFALCCNLTLPDYFGAENYRYFYFGITFLVSIPIWQITTHCPETPRYLVYKCN
jgi:hypothetical protein